MKTETKNWWEDEQEARAFVAWLVMEGGMRYGGTEVVRANPTCYASKYAEYQAAKAKEAEEASLADEELPEKPESVTQFAKMAGIAVGSATCYRGFAAVCGSPDGSEDEVVIVAASEEALRRNWQEITGIPLGRIEDVCIFHTSAKAKPQYAEVVDWPNEDGVWRNIKSELFAFAKDGVLITESGQEWTETSFEPPACWVKCKVTIPEIEPEPVEPPKYVRAKYVEDGKEDWWHTLNGGTLEPMGPHSCRRICDLTVIPHEANDPELVRLIEEAGEVQS